MMSDKINKILTYSNALISDDRFNHKNKIKIVITIITKCNFKTACQLVVVGSGLKI